MKFIFSAVFVILLGGGCTGKFWPHHPVPSVTPNSEQKNAELAHEMFAVVLLREPRPDPSGRAEFGSLVDTLNQGASLEGIYNGIVHSANYRELERESLRMALRKEVYAAFGRELALLEASRAAPTAFDERSPRPATKIRFPGEPVNPADALEANPGGEAVLSAQVYAAEVYSRFFAKASLFTLKRILGEEALKVIEEKGASGQLPKWYGGWAAQAATAGVDFGLALRNRSDAAFHETWARAATRDHLIWEVLNRLHRIVNSAR